MAWPAVGPGWNVNGRWYTEVQDRAVAPSEYGTHLSTLNWQSDLLLTQGPYPFDLAIHTLLAEAERAWASKASVYPASPASAASGGHATRHRSASGRPCSAPCRRVGRR